MHTDQEWKKKKNIFRPSLELSLDEKKIFIDEYGNFNLLIYLN